MADKPAAPAAALPVPEKKREVAKLPSELRAMARIDQLLRPFGIAAKLRILAWNGANIQEEIHNQPCSAPPSFANETVAA